ncbi:MAG: hypothetical protein K2K63_18040 [Acetatifactor sp.]|nr:hypothetical protein [Acetatifactor sp.]
MKKSLCIMMCICIFLSSAISVHAGQIEENVGNTITVNECEYNAQQFMQRVIECTKSREPIAYTEDECGDLIEFRYDDNGYRIKKITSNGEFCFEYDIDGNLVKEILPDGETIDYLYTVKDGLATIYGLMYQETEYTYITDNDENIAGLCDMSGQEVCIYQYDEYGYPVHIYEASIGGVIEHFDNVNDPFVGCVNPIRYRGDCYDAETKMYCIKEGGYYNTQENKVVGNDYYIDKQELFGDQYQALDTAFRNGYKENGMRISSNDYYLYLEYAALQYYEANLGEYTGSYSNAGNSWYTNFSGDKQYFLVARIIYAENTYKDEDDWLMEKVFRDNRQGIGWAILNRYLEDIYRDDNGLSLYFSDRNSVPSFYSVLTKNSAFTSINGNNAKGYISTDNVAYQEAFWIASCMEVCRNFEEWNAVVPRPTGVTSQCYFRGSLSSTSAPNSTWKNVIFPGFETDYTGRANYAGFTYYNIISKFNILFSYSTESLYIDSYYYK